MSDDCEENISERVLDSFKFDKVEIKQLGEFVCQVCGKHFRGKRNLADHKTNLHTFEKCSCKFSGKTFERKRLLLGHMDIHQHKKCLSCNKSLKISTYYKHLKICQNYQCTICDFVTKSKREFSKHWTQQHEIKKEEQCTLCDYTSTSTSNFRKHTYFVHGNKIDCNECGKKIHFQLIEKHKEKHRSKLECNFCLKLFYPKNLAKHTSKHSENRNVVNKYRKEHNCDHCPFKSYRRHDLQRHIIRKHVIPKPEKNKECETCNFKFTRSQNYEKHIKKGCQGGRILVVF